jgi:tRNA pseudouridine55 synthase
MTNDSLDQVPKPTFSTSGEGVLNLDKPGGTTSHDVVKRIRQLTGVRRVGHAGTLDPLATGVLLVCMGRTTRLVEYLVGQPKVYEASVRLGQATETYDADGSITFEKPVDAITLQRIEKGLSQFRGPIRQRPPMYSAVKQNGQPLYKLARRGITIERAWREVTIHELVLLDWTPPDCKLRIACSSGTYVRSLAHDLGELLGCGAHIAALRRTAIGSFKIETAVPLAELQPANWRSHLLPSDVTVSHLPRLDLPETEVARLQQGQRIQRLPAQPRAPLVRAYGRNGRFIGIIAAAEQEWQPRKMFHPLPGE